MKSQFNFKFEDIIRVENLLEAWKEFVNGKRNKPDVQEFFLRLMDNILALHSDLVNQTYRHGPYQAFKINDPKPRDIHKASVRDRLLHHAVYRKLYPFFDKIFIADSFSCRTSKGTHRAMNRFRSFFYKVSQNNTRTCWVLKGDIRKCFASISHDILLKVLRQYIADGSIIWLLDEIISSFYSVRPGIGLPLGNLTSQLFVNVYLNELDQFVKQTLKAKYYIRYTDDFVILSEKREQLEQYITLIYDFLHDKLQLNLHPQKVFIKTVASGVDFLGWAHFHDHRVLRNATKKRMLRRLQVMAMPATVNSYKGLLKHGNTWKILKAVLEADKINSNL